MIRVFAIFAIIFGFASISYAQQPDRLDRIEAKVDSLGVKIDKLLSIKEKTEVFDRNFPAPQQDVVKLGQSLNLQGRSAQQQQGPSMSEGDCGSYGVFFSRLRERRIIRRGY